MDVTIRQMDTRDEELFVKLRLDYIRCTNNIVLPVQVSALSGQLIQYYRKHIVDGTFIGVTAYANGEAAGGAYLTIAERPANLGFMNGKVGTVLNVLTYPPYRRNGIAEAILRHLLNAAELAGVSQIELCATECGKPLYERLGFTFSQFPRMIKEIGKYDC